METTLCLATRIHETFLCNGVSVYAFHPHPPSQDARRPAVMLSRDAPAHFALLLHAATVGDARAQRLLALRYLRGRAAAAGRALAARPRRDAGPCGRPPLAASVGRPIARPRAARPRRAV